MSELCDRNRRLLNLAPFKPIQPHKYGPDQSRNRSIRQNQGNGTNSGGKLFMLLGKATCRP